MVGSSPELVLPHPQGPHHATDSQPSDSPRWTGVFPPVASPKPSEKALVALRGHLPTFERWTLTHQVHAQSLPVSIAVVSEAFGRLEHPLVTPY